MLRNLVNAWWLVNLRGVLAVLFGGFLIFLAGSMQGQLSAAIALVGVLLIFVFYLICSGLLSIATIFATAGGHHRWATALIHGTILVTLGVWLFFSNQFSLMWLVWLTVANAFGSGLLELIVAHAVRRHVDAWVLAISGSASVIISLVLVLARNAWPSGIVLTLGVYAIFYGVVLVLFSLRLHGMRHLHIAHPA
jgi:uncharacterized membrane protein HdeD (DUF308 family)